ncbi:MAG TPA: menaquinone biosynthesis protein [Bryobacteraceae bacterium]|nr:menaquinone biosynthesis protein [Bryobacteraceae bacterium]
MSLNEEIRPRIGAVSYLNTVPLVYGMLKGPQQQLADLSFSTPSVCAAQLESGVIDIGLVPVAEIARQGLEIVPGLGIAAQGAVRSILLISKGPFRNIRTVATDSSSRTSVELARVILREQFGATPMLQPNEPDLDRMLQRADAALIIGDPALRIEPAGLPYEWLDLAEAWTALTQLPFVFAAWAGKPGIPTAALATLTSGSYRFGQENMAEIVSIESARRGISKGLADRYLRHHLRYEIGPKELEGWDTFLSLAGLAAPAGART